MAKSIRSKRKRFFRAIKRQQNAPVEEKRLKKICSKLGTVDEVIPDDPKRFSFTAPRDEKDDERERKSDEVKVFLKRKNEQDEWKAKTEFRLMQLKKTEERQKREKVERKLHIKELKGSANTSTAASGDVEMSDVATLLKRKAGNSGVLKKPKHTRTKEHSRKQLKVKSKAKSK